jgi:hypothetical protein
LGTASSRSLKRVVPDAASSDVRMPELDFRKYSPPLTSSGEGTYGVSLS